MCFEIFTKNLISTFYNKSNLSCGSEHLHNINQIANTSRNI